MTEPKIYTLYDVKKAVNDAIDNTSIDVDDVENYYEGLMEVLKGKVQPHSAASNHDLDMKIFDKVLQLARKNLNAQPTNENKKPKENSVNVGEISTTPITPANEQTEKKKKSSKSKNKSFEGEDIKKKDSEGTRKKKSDNVEEHVTVRKKRRKLAEVLRQEAREQVFVMPLSIPLDLATPSPIHTRSKSSTFKAITWEERDYSPTTTASSLAMVLYKNSKNKKSVETAQSQDIESPTKSNALIFLKKAIPIPSIPHEDVTIPEPNKAVEKRSDKFQNRPVPTNPRWQEFPTVIEQLIDEVLTAVHFRADNDEKKSQMRSGILDIILFEVTAVKASKDRNLGVTTVRKYSRDVKVRLESFLGTGVAEDEFFEKKIKKNKEKNKNDNRKELIYNKKGEIVEETVINEVTEEEEKLLDKEVVDNEPENIVNQKTIKKSNNNNNITLNNSSVPFDVSTNSLSIMKTIQQCNNSLYLSSPTFERRPLKGTKEQIKQMIKKFLTGKYSGGSEADYRLKSMRNSFDIPTELFKSGFILISRFFKLEEAEKKNKGKKKYCAHF
ncbi:hypothetical protein Mgra_00003561 [Meloidogyne graminicola]|uniref:Uncharacterized protein n=1 Tax=Meloidogyne graminicola TaxID=189291 RepID=A0A8S9ZTF7_9BILA|nr:hypothetical protein Mgra_00003561 [Meloidogyne graminicola]